MLHGWLPLVEVPCGRVDRMELSWCVRVKPKADRVIVNAPYSYESHIFCVGLNVLSWLYWLHVTQLLHLT